MFDIVVVAIWVLTLVLGLWGAVKFSGAMEGYVSAFAGETPIPTSIIAFALTLILIIVVVHFVSGLITRVVDMTLLSVPNKIGGGLLRAARNAFVMSAAIGIAERLLPTGEGSFLGGLRAGSSTYAYLADFASFLFPYVTAGFEQAKQIITY